eukprot:3338795-Rhodomonas_salina.7
MQSPVLTQCMLPPDATMSGIDLANGYAMPGTDLANGYAMSGTDLAYGATRLYNAAEETLVDLSDPSKGRNSPLPSYAMSGTDLAYAATRQRGVRY